MDSEAIKTFYEVQKVGKHFQEKILSEMIEEIISDVFIKDYPSTSTEYDPKDLGFLQGREASLNILRKKLQKIRKNQND